MYISCALYKSFSLVSLSVFLLFDTSGKLSKDGRGGRSKSGLNLDSEGKEEHLTIGLWTYTVFFQYSVIFLLSVVVWFLFFMWCDFYASVAMLLSMVWSSYLLWLGVFCAFYGCYAEAIQNDIQFLSPDRWKNFITEKLTGDGHVLFPINLCIAIWRSFVFWVEHNLLWTVCPVCLFGWVSVSVKLTHEWKILAWETKYSLNHTTKCVFALMPK